ncbi:glycoside hydrolase family 130 protein [Novosphingopyxis sp. YJ-S2-01]|uniref:glycoside hydrolase family 130 protein n=1 Tax=Novosphingopyxis sp. YJ-S2-01 TaxID=2794021 RepID=UPI0018DB1B6B|nr:glycoside hydrolase family 130 protein [Novosphingopyxis sp. YJ-S2-01]MBH9536848.1 glycoside hydrolase family 130 protein [Novosphingopyxis sp. YJ-S2-01]
MLKRFDHDLRLHADPSRVVVRPFHLAWQASGINKSRSERLVAEVLEMEDREAAKQLEAVLRDFEPRHWQTRRVFMTRFEEIDAQMEEPMGDIGDTKRQLIGAYFCHEYSYAAAAIMNPSVVPHWDQSGMPEGSCRFIMSLRTVGEGHISSVAFREGIATEDGELRLAPEPPFATATDTAQGEEEVPEGPVTVIRHRDSTLSGTVIFPITDAQRNGLEDLRLVQFTHEDGSTEWLGTYTAYSGREIQSELLRTRDWRHFDLKPIAGAASRNKGIALFPRKIGDHYMAIGRQDGENLFLLKSDSLERWDGGDKLLEPKYPWEFVQIGNCGSPIELDEGWLLLTHGVGAMRKYAIGAVLLDKDDPSKVIARADEPILTAANADREGYVPNVVYTCGAMRLGDTLFLPYGIADSSVAFAFVPIKQLLARLK